MRVFVAAGLFACGLALMGCSKKPNFDGPTVNAFVGQVTQNGVPITLPENSGIQLKLWHEKGTSFLIPLDTAGNFKIGWMPIGKYSMMMEGPPPPDGKGPPMKKNVEGQLSIEPDKTEYKIELGPNFRF